ncbi:MAG: hypothetical protein DBX59_11420 [Bacillota bacterium]|nr:MAG: hypothetical protein DBX59_11420 [Bacillota bacterium]
MKKSAFSIIIVLCFAAAIAYSGCYDGGTFTAKSYVCEEDVRSVVVNAADREVEICAAADGKIRAEYIESEKEYYEIDVQDAQLTIKLVYDKEWSDFIGTAPAAEHRTIKLYLPDGVLSDISVKTTNESIKFALAVTGSVTLENNGGDLKLENVSVGKSLLLTAKNGNIAGTVRGDLSDFSVSCTVKKGESNLPASKPNGAKSLIANCNNGDIRIDFIGG